MFDWVQFGSILKNKIDIISNELEYKKEIVDFFISNDSKQTCHNAKKVFENSFNHINKLIDSLRDLNKYVDIFSVKENFFIYLCIYDRVRKELNDNLSLFSAISKNIVQALEVEQSQYLPKPVLSRSYFYKGIHEYILTQLNMFLKNTGIDRSIELVWDYKEDYELNSFDYIESSFYHQDIPMNFGIYAHELGHIVVNEKLYDFKKEYIDFSKKVFDEKYVGYEEFIIVEDICDELLCDLFGYFYYGDGYILSFIYEVAGVEFDASFLDEDGKFIYNEIGYNLKRDSLLVRLFVLSNLIDKFEVDLSLSYEHKNLLVEYWGLFVNDFMQCYGKHKTLKRYAQQHIEIVENLSEVLLKFFDIEHNRKKIEKSYNDVLTKGKKDELFQEKIFLDAWSGFFKNGFINIGSFRQELMDIELKEQQIAIFGKIGVDGATQEKLECLYKQKSFLCGMYSFFEIVDREKKEQNCDLKYYKTKQLLAKLDSNVANIDKDKLFNLMVTFKIDNNCNKNQIVENKETIAKQFSNYNFTLYKSLGYKDMFCYFQYINLDEIFEIKRYFANGYSKTHSYIILRDIKNSIIKEDGYEIRVIAKTQFDDFECCFDGFDAVMTTGVFDCEFRANSKGFATSRLLKIMADKSIADVQIKIDKVIKKG